MDRLRAAADELQMHGLSLAQREHHVDVPTWLGKGMLLCWYLLLVFQPRPPKRKHTSQPQAETELAAMPSARLRAVLADLADLVHKWPAQSPGLSIADFPVFVFFYYVYFYFYFFLKKSVFARLCVCFSTPRVH